MATYKVLQDIEAEDKLFGPLTLKQFIFAAIAILLAYVEFRLMTSGIPLLVRGGVFFVILPFLLVFGFLAAPIGRDQPNDIWLIARLRFLFKPRTRIWNQDGLNELVTITAPKKLETVFVNSFSQEEVRSRLRALANTVDSRGWAVKNVNTNLFAQPGYLTSSDTSDRLVDPASIPQEVPAVDVQASDDMLDPTSNTRAQSLERLIKQSSTQHKQKVRDQVTGKAPAQTTPQDYWFMNQPKSPQIQLPQDYATFASQSVVAPGTNTNDTAVATEEEKAIAHKVVEEKLLAKSHVTDHMRVLQPLHDEEGNPLPAPPVTYSAGAPTTNSPTDQGQTGANPAILNLAQNDDLNIATIARQADKIQRPKSKDDGEVVISLH